MAAVPGNLHTEPSGKIEINFAVARHQKKKDLGGDWCDVVEHQFGNDASEKMSVLDFAREEFYIEQFHIPHGVDFSLDSIDLDIHYMVTTSETAIVKFKISLWHAYAGRTLSSIAAPDATYTYSLSFTGAAAQIFSVGYVEDALDLSAWQSNRNIHDGMIAKVERLAGADGDTHNGNFQLIHGEMWLPTDGRIIIPM